MDSSDVLVYDSSDDEFDEKVLRRGRESRPSSPPPQVSAEAAEAATASAAATTLRLRVSAYQCPVPSLVPEAGGPPSDVTPLLFRRDASFSPRQLEEEGTTLGRAIDASLEAFASEKGGPSATIADLVAVRLRAAPEPGGGKESSDAAEFDLLDGPMADLMHSGLSTCSEWIGGNRMALDLYVDAKGCGDDAPGAFSLKATSKRKRPASPSSSSSSSSSSSRPTRTCSSSSQRDSDDKNETADIDLAADANLAAEVAAMSGTRSNMISMADVISNGRWRAHVTDHSYIGGGKFLVDWYEREAGGNDAAETPVATTWTRMNEMPVPGAALEYIDSDRFQAHGPQWEHDSQRRRLRELVQTFMDGFILDNKLPLQEGQDRCLAEVDFCCFLCQCDERKKGNLGDVIKDEFTNKYHRCCCHDLDTVKKKEMFCSSLGRIQKKIDDNLQRKSEEDKYDDIGDFFEEDEKLIQRFDRDFQSFLDMRCRSAKKDEARTEGDYYARPAQETVRMTDPVAAKTDKAFHILRRERENDPSLKKRAVVLEVFSGIGCGLVALKKLGIDIKTVISVDHDRIAQHVYHANHCNDGIEHISKFETYDELKEGLWDLVRQQPIDIILGGPPCTEHSAVNAFRRGDDDQRSGYMMRDFATSIIGAVQEYNKTFHGRKISELFFLCENVVGAEKATANVYKVSEYRVNAASFGPCHRDRIFYFNWAPDAMPEDDNAVGGSSCLTDGWMTPCMFKLGIDQKVRTLLACKTRIKDTTLFKFKIRDGFEGLTAPGDDRPAIHGERELFSTNDRERLMGLPVDYVRAPVDNVFNQLRQGYLTSIDNCLWSDIVSPNFWKFLSLGPQGHSFEVNDTCSDFGLDLYTLKIKERNQKTKVVMTSDEYAWHLIGNGFSIPQVMFLLRPLQNLFQTREYPGYSDKVFAWEDGDRSNDAEIQARHASEAASDTLGAEDAPAATAGPSADTSRAMKCDTDCSDDEQSMRDKQNFTLS